jgi:hypothetical protein
LDDAATDYSPELNEAFIDKLRASGLRSLSVSMTIDRFFVRLPEEAPLGIFRLMFIFFVEELAVSFGFSYGLFLLDLSMYDLLRMCELLLRVMIFSFNEKFGPIGLNCIPFRALILL